MTQDRRNHKRVYICTRGWLETEKFTVYGFVSNISEGGLVIHSPIDVSPGSNVKLEIKLPAENTKIKATGTVIWTGDNKGINIIGIKFKEISSGEECLKRLIYKYPIM